MNANQEHLIRSLDELFEKHTVAQWLSAAKAIGLPVQEDGLRHLRGAVKAAIKSVDREASGVRTKPKPSPKTMQTKTTRKKSVRKLSSAKDSKLRQNLLRPLDEIDGEFTRWLDIISPPSIHEVSERRWPSSKDSTMPRISPPAKDRVAARQFPTENKKPRR